MAFIYLTANLYFLLLNLGYKTFIKFKTIL